PAAGRAVRPPARRGDHHQQRAGAGDDVPRASPARARRPDRRPYGLRPRLARLTPPTCASAPRCAADGLEPGTLPCRNRRNSALSTLAHVLLSAGVRKIDPPGPKPIRGDLNRAEFDAMDATVRYYDGLASYAEFSAATEHLKLLRLATDFER